MEPSNQGILVNTSPNLMDSHQSKDDYAMLKSTYNVVKHSIIGTTNGPGHTANDTKEVFQNVSQVEMEDAIPEMGQSIEAPDDECIMSESIAQSVRQSIYFQQNNNMYSQENAGEQGLGDSGMIFEDSDADKEQHDNSFELLDVSQSDSFYNLTSGSQFIKENPGSKPSYTSILYHGVSNLGHRLWQQTQSEAVESLNNLEAQIFSRKFFSQAMWSNFLETHVNEVLWFTYCSQFKPLLVDIGKHQDKKVAKLQSDVGWGCTVRSLQMLVSNCILKSIRNQEKNLEIAKKKTVSHFNNDKRGSEAAFGIQNVAEIGLKQYGVYPGQWYGVHAMSQIMEQLNKDYAPVSNFRIVTFSDGNINIDKIREEATFFESRWMMSNQNDKDEGEFVLLDTEGQESKLINSNNENGNILDELKPDQNELNLAEAETYHQTEKTFDFGTTRNANENKEEASNLNGKKWVNNVLVIVGNRYGMKQIQQEYFKAIKRFMNINQFMGLVGGQPKLAYYFIGNLEHPAETLQSQAPLDRLLYLDPHQVRPSNAPNSCRTPRSLHLSQLDPCMSFGFLLQSEADLEAFTNELNTSVQEDKPYQIFYKCTNDDLSISCASIMSAQSLNMVGGQTRNKVGDQSVMSIASQLD